MQTTVGGCLVSASLPCTYVSCVHLFGVSVLLTLSMITWADNFQADDITERGFRLCERNSIANKVVFSFSFLKKFWKLRKKPIIFCCTSTLISHFTPSNQTVVFSRLWTYDHSSVPLFQNFWRLDWPLHPGSILRSNLDSQFWQKKRSKSKCNL